MYLFKKKNVNLQIFDEKTGSIVGTLHYSLSTLITKVNLEDMQHPYDLQSAATDSKLIMSMSLRILKYEQPEINEDDEEDQDINELKKKIERQESSVNSSYSSSGN